MAVREAVWVVVQARTGSTRRPAKVLARLGDGTLLEAVHQRASLVGPPVCVAIPHGDTPIAHLCLDKGWLYVDGPEEDVLARFVLTARVLDADHIVRVTADCPFLDVEAARLTLNQHLRSGAELTTFHLAEGRGVQVFTRDALERANDHAGRRDRHSPDVWLLDHGRVEYMKFSVDTEDELRLARRRMEEIL